MMNRTFRRILISLLVFAGFSSCDPWFAYSPYEAQLDDRYHHTTEKNLEALKALDAGDSKPFKVAVLSDTHYHFGKLEDAISYINSRDDYTFALVTGDLSENGLKQELVYFHNLMSRLSLPYLTVIGNHDYLSNGEEVYRQMFGAFNYTFVFNNVKFVLFDNTTIESRKAPDMEWLASNLVNDQGYDHVIPLAHIPPFDGQMAEYDDLYHQLMVENHIDLSIHGHKHEFTITEAYGDGVQYVTVSSPQKRTFTELIITPDTVDVRKIEY